MIFWSYMVLIDLLIPGAMFFVGMLFRKHPPKNISGIWGYRTRRSMKTPATWEFANRYLGKIWYHWGMILMPLSVVPMLFVIGQSASRINTVTAVICVLQLIPLIVSNFITEKALRDRFDADGVRREPEEIR